MIILHLLECVEISALDGLMACRHLYSHHVNAPMRRCADAHDALLCRHAEGIRSAATPTCRHVDVST